MIEFYRRLGNLKQISEPVVPEIEQKWLEDIGEFYQNGKSAILEAQLEKLTWLRTHAYRLPQDTMHLVSRLEPEFSFLPAVEKSLHIMGVTELGSSLEVNTEVLRLTFLRAKEIRSRYTIFDFLEGQGLLDQVVDEILSPTLDS